MSNLPDQNVRETAEKLLSAPLLFPDEFKRWLGDFVATNVPLIPYSHIFGAKHNTARSGASITASESTTSTTAYVDLTTAGPSITGIANGTYLVMYGARCRDRASISVNSAAPSDDDSIWGEEAGPAATRMKIVSLNSNNENSIAMKYRGTNAFSHRWLSIMRLGAPS